MPNFAPLLFNKLLSPFYSSILKPNLDLRLRQTQLFREIKPLTTHHVLLARKLSFQALELLDGKDGTHAFWLFDGPVCFFAPCKESSYGASQEKQLNKI